MTTDQIALFVIEQKALVHKDYPAMSEDHIKDEVMMRLARRLTDLRAGLERIDRGWSVVASQPEAKLMLLDVQSLLAGARVYRSAKLVRETIAGIIEQHVDQVDYANKAADAILALLAERAS